MANTVSISMTSENKDLLKAFQTQNREIEKLKAKLDAAAKSAREGEKVGKVAKHNAREVDKLTRELAQATAKNQQLADSARAGEKSAQSVERYRRKVHDLQGKLVETKASQERLNKEARDWEKAARAGERYKQKVEQLRAKLSEVGAAGKSAAKSSESGFGRAESAIVKFGSGIAATVIGLASVQQAARLIRSEWEKIEQLAKGAADAQKTAGESLREVRKPFRPDAEMDAEQMESRLMEMARRHGSDVPTVAATASEAFSAKGSLSNVQALSAVETAVRMAPRDRGEQVTLASRYLDLMNVGGLDDARMAAGLVTELKGSSRVKSTQLAGANLVPAISSLVAGGDSLESAAELTATLNNLMLDAEGSVTRTAIINLSAKLKDAGIGGANTAERIATLQADPEARQAFLAANSFGAEAQAPIEQWLSGSETARATERAVRRGISPVGGASVGAFEKRLEFINAGQFQRQVDLADRGTASLEHKRLRDRHQAMTGRVLEQFDQAMANVDLGGIDFIQSRAARFNVSAEIARGENPAAIAAEYLTRSGSDTRVSPSDSAYLLEKAKEMESLVPAIEKLERELSEQTKELRKQTSEMERPDGGRRSRPSSSLSVRSSIGR